LAEPFISEIRLFTFGFTPRGWAACDGQLLAINQNLALFSLIGTYYGGDGRINFALPDLRGAVPMHVGGNLTLGQKGGEAGHTLTVAEMPSHMHPAQASSQNASQPVPANALLASALNLYRGPDSLTPINPGTISLSGGNQPHENRSPYLTLMFCIALVGIFPSQN
jgi:microcystin-dependent protein